MLRDPDVHLTEARTELAAAVANAPSAKEVITPLRRYKRRMALLTGLLGAALAAHPPGAATALGLGLGAAGAAVLATGLLAVARAGALARHPSGRARAAAVLTRCLLASTVGAVAMAVVGVVAVSGTRAPAPGLGAGAAAVLLVGLATLAGRSRRRS